LIVIAFLGNFVRGPKPRTPGRVTPGVDHSKFAPKLYQPPAIPDFQPPKLPGFEVPNVVTPGAKRRSSSRENLVFSNKSGDDVLVKVVGPTRTRVLVRKGSSESAEVQIGSYHIKARCGEPGRFRYWKGEPFEIKENRRLTITLHRVASGNYDTGTISAGEFDR
jgi:hypothetical protein